jgi:hypothetical protein
MDCDGTFSLEEFRKIVEQKKKVQEESHEKRKVIARLQAEDVALQEELSRLEELAS